MTVYELILGFVNPSREEIRRLKAIYPNMTHKEAFSAAAKNVSSFTGKLHVCLIQQVLNWLFYEFSKRSRN